MAALRYFENQDGAGRMDYASRVSANDPIGVTEAVYKVPVKQRLCGSGMKWKEPGAAVLRVQYLTYTTGRWSSSGGKIDRYGFRVAA